MDAIILYLKYYFKADTIYNIHSPFVYDFIVNILDHSKPYYAFDKLEYQRKMLLSNDNYIDVVDLGAGSKTDMGSKRKISQIASTALGSKKKCKILFHLVDSYNANHILELGSCLGLSSLYMHYARKKAIIDTIEGSPQIAKIARKLHKANGASTINVHEGEFDQVFENLLTKDTQYDLIYIDGNHTYEATRSYYKKLSSLVPSSGCIVFDDINWSKGMRQAWEEIIEDPKITLSIDLYDMGIVFFNPGLKKQNFTIIEYYNKPWKIGLF